MKSYQEFFAELKRRHVFKVAAIYGGVAFVLLQVADLLGQGLRLPESFMPFMTAVILLGFPLALVLAWAFEITPDGVHRATAAQPGEVEAILGQPRSQRWPVGLLALLGVVAMLAGTWWAGRRSAPDGAEVDRAETADLQLAYADLEDDPRPSIAVLPFVNLSAEEAQEYFSDGMTEEILNTLARIGQLRVSGRTSAFAYKGRNVDLREIGSDLGVRYLLEGSVRKAGDRLRITAQLIDAADGSHLWSDQYDRTLEDVFAIQTEIAGSIARELRVSLGLEAEEGLVRPTEDLAAYDLYLAGRAQMRQRGASLLDAQRMFEAAIARDSSWAPAWAALAESREISIWYRATFDGRRPDSATVRSRLAAAEAAARRALELDPGNASALVALASVQRDRGQWREARATYRRALSLDPDNAEAHQQYGEYLREIGLLDEAVRALDRAAVLDPAPIRLAVLGHALALDARPEEAVAVFESGVERDPNLTLPTLWAGAWQVNLQAGNFERAVALGTLLSETWGPPPWVEVDDWDARRFVRTHADLLAAGGTEPVAPEIRPLLDAENWMQIGRPDSALAELEDPLSGVYRLAGVAGATNLWHPLFDPLRDDPRFQHLVEAARVPVDRPRRTPPAERKRPSILEGASVGASGP